MNRNFMLTNNNNKSYDPPNVETLGQFQEMNCLNSRQAGEISLTVDISKLRLN